ncbi:hypothetical protein FRB99_008999 [Tulasnella sp. 403]|nr:hypothetical protein FRB99_008999 [Tulasnella sp. 403]
MNSRRINPFGDDDEELDFSGAWGASNKNASPSDILKDTLKKEAVIKDIVASQGDLKTLLARVKSVQAEVDKLQSGNATLQLYIENLTKQVAKS